MTQHDALDKLVEDRAKLPKFCPSWCTSGPAGHAEAMLEGCDLESASMHLSADIGGQQDEIRNYVTGEVVRPGKGGWRVQLRQQVRPGHRLDVPLLGVECHIRESATPTAYVRTELNLTTSEARKLAAQLLHLADAEDLRRYDTL
ncbi:hypothetical protein NPS01_21150 [Nocardioides psychrotolerans]|uniref:Uncharacterized protein n=1 Tax=Nocardioides psychrotolerans TaxID=1005945 RepID=A0A1I3KF40_9ACTN|nr:hypothetical protein [Nocardioides psychrotolerans]GEP38452.1 hypothetical protein NPS01_21150 [Nocardioides psychrotolerans]SFI71131.1 hypothetical protein SAMN05216561_11222 [Nocardioides psychrotolerans]